MEDGTLRVEPPRAKLLRRQGGPMSTTEKTVSWVVYRMTIHGKPSGMIAVCEQGEWDAMEHERPGYHTLVLAGIHSEGEAERLARMDRVDTNTVKPFEPEVSGR